MGLDMYLRREIHLTNSEGLDLPFVNTLDGHDEYFARHYLTANQLVMCWRKANAIHGWFVDNVQQGDDDCRAYDVSIDDLKSLASVCKEALDERDFELIPPREGFFFGSSEPDDYYWYNLQDTHGKLMKLIEQHKPNYSYRYTSSW